MNLMHCPAMHRSSSIITKGVCSSSSSDICTVSAPSLLHTCSGLVLFVVLCAMVWTLPGTQASLATGSNSTERCVSTYGGTHHAPNLL